MVSRIGLAALGLLLLVCAACGTDPEGVIRFDVGGAAESITGTSLREIRTRTVTCDSRDCLTYTCAFRLFDSSYGAWLCFPGADPGTYTDGVINLSKDGRAYVSQCAWPERVSITVTQVEGRLQGTFEATVKRMPITEDGIWDTTQGEVVEITGGSFDVRNLTSGCGEDTCPHVDDLLLQSCRGS